MEGDPLGKLLPLIQHIKMRRFDLYHPLQQVALDERMMSEARSHLIQYMHNKSTKWEFKLWVLADTMGYTLDIDVYTGKSVDRSDHGVAFDVITKLVEPLAKSLQLVHFELNVVVSSKIYIMPQGSTRHAWTSPRDRLLHLSW